MTRVLFVARYRDPAMFRKVELLSERHGITLQMVMPNRWQDDLLAAAAKPVTSANLRVLAVPMIGNAGDPHRALYRTRDFNLTAFKPDIVHAEEEPDSLAALQIALARRVFAPGSRLLLSTWQNVARPLRPPVRLVTATALAATSRMLVANSEAGAILRQRGYRKPITLLPPIGVDTRLFHQAEAGRAMGPLRIGYVGRLVPEKGLGVLLRAFRAAQRCIEAELVIAGGGPLQHVLERSIARSGFGDSVRLVPGMPPAEIAALMRNLDVLVLPSRTTPVWQEQFGRVLTEAMASGVVPVGSDSGAIPEVIGSAGLVFREGDDVMLAGLLIRLGQNPALRADLRRRGLERVNAGYTQERIAERTAELYAEVMQSP